MHQSHNQWKVEKVGDLVGVVANLEARSLPEFGVVVVDIFHRVRQRFRHTRESERCGIGFDEIERELDTERKTYVLFGSAESGRGGKWV